MAVSTIGGMIAFMSVTKAGSAISTPKVSKAPDWIDDLRASLDNELRLQHRMDQLEQLEQLRQARDAMIDAAAMRKYVELRGNDLQTQKNILQQKINDQPTAPGREEWMRTRQTKNRLQHQLTDLNKQLTDLNNKVESLMAREEERLGDYMRLRAEAEASQAAVELFDAARASALNELTASGVLDDVSDQPYQEAQRIWLKLQDEEFIVCSGGLLDRTWMIVQSLFVPTVPVAAVLAAAAAEDAENAVLQLYQWERDRLLTLAKGAGAAAVTVLAGLIATGFGGKTGVTSITLLVAAPLVVILLFWAGFLLAGLRGLADQYPIAREMVER